MRRRSALVACLLAAGLWLGAAAARADTILHLSETASVMVHPDELVATLRAEAEAPTAAEAAHRVNAAVAAALDAIKKVAGVSAATQGYATWHVPPKQGSIAHWQASQGIELKSHDGAVLLRLVGSLQGRGLAVGVLSWRLSSPAEEAAHDTAMTQALKRLRGRAEKAAALLDLRFGAFKEIRLGASPPPVFPRAMMAGAAMAAPPPSAVAQDVRVTATVEADVVLVPK